MRPEGSGLQFTHALLRDAIYESILKSRRKELHLRAAEWFRTHDAALRAEHLAAAHDPVQFQRTSCLIGELSLQLGRTHDALTSYREALDFAIDPTGRGMAYFGIAASLRIMDRYEEALDALSHAEQALGTNIEPQMKARLYALRGNLCFPLGRVDACLAAHEQAQRYAEQAGTPLELARALGGIGDAWYQRGRIVSAHRHFQRCIDEARRHGLTSVLLANLPMVCVTHHFCCEFEQATRAYEEGLELVRHIGDLRCELLLNLVASSTLLMRARHTDSTRHAEKVIALSQRVGARRFHAEALGLIAHNLLCAGERTQAQRYAMEGLEIARDSAMNYCGATLLGMFAQATDDPNARTAALKEGEALLADGSVSHTYFDYYESAIEVGLATHAWSEVRRCADALRRYTSEEPVPWAQLLMERATLLADIGEGRSTAETHRSIDALLSHCKRVEANVLAPRIEHAPRLTFS
jgi:tetratricopeptide (TPR) repeat protein